MFKPVLRTFLLSTGDSCARENERQCDHNNNNKNNNFDGGGGNGGDGRNNNNNNKQKTRAKYVMI